MMKSKVKFAFLFGVTYVTLSSAHAQDRDKKSTSMQDVLSSLRKPAMAQAENMHFESILSGQPIGFLVASLLPTSGGGPAGFDYRVEAAMKLPNGMRVEANIKAKLGNLFEPITIESRREVTTPDGRKELTIERTQVREKDIEISREAGGAAPVSRTVARPDETFAFAMEFLVQRVDVVRHPSFIINELNPQEGTIIVQSFATEIQPDKTRSLTSREKDGSVGYAFKLDESDKLISWSEPPMPLESRRCTENRIEELRSLVRK